MNDQPRDEKAPERAEPPTVEQPTTQPAAAADGALSRESAPAADPELSRESSAAEPAAPGQPAPDQASGAPAGTTDQTAVHGQQPPPAPPTPQLSQPGPGQAYGAWGPPPAAPRPSGGFRRFAGHRATQLVGVGVLGLLVGGGVVGGIAAATHHGPRDGRPGIHRQYDGPNGNQGFNGRGPGFGGRGNNGSGPGSGDGI